MIVIHEGLHGLTHEFLIKICAEFPGYGVGFRAEALECGQDILQCFETIHKLKPSGTIDKVECIPIPLNGSICAIQYITVDNIPEGLWEF